VNYKDVGIVRMLLVRLSKYLIGCLYFSKAVCCKNLCVLWLSVIRMFTLLMLSVPPKLFIAKLSIVRLSAMILFVIRVSGCL